MPVVSDFVLIEKWTEFYICLRNFEREQDELVHRLFREMQ